MERKKEDRYDLGNEALDALSPEAYDVCVIASDLRNMEPGQWCFVCSAIRDTKRYGGRTRDGGRLIPQMEGDLVRALDGSANYFEFLVAKEGKFDTLYVKRK